MPIRIVPPSGSADSDDSSSENSGPARLGRKGDIDSNEAIDTSDYPLVDIHVNADLEETVELEQTDFTVCEEGEQTDIEAFDFRASSLDLVFVFDDTGSMGDEIAGAKRGITKLTNAVADRSIDAQYGLVSFKDSVEIDQGLTSDPAEIKRKIDRLKASGGGDYPEANFDAIEKALDLNLRDDAETVFVDITDATSHYRNDGSGYSDYLKHEVADDLNDAEVTFVAIAPDRDEEAFLMSDEKANKGSLKSLAGDVSGIWTDIDEEDFDWVLDRIIALLVGTYIITIHTCTPPGNQRSLTVEFDHPRFESDSDTAWMSIPSHETLPPECAEEEGELKKAGESGVDTRTDPVGKRDDLGVEERSEDEVTKSDDSDSEPIPLAIEANKTSISPGDTVEITVRDQNGRVADASVTGPGVNANTSDRGTVSVTVDTEGEAELQANGPSARHTEASTTIEVGDDSPAGVSNRVSGVSERPGNLTTGTSDSSSDGTSEEGADVTQVTILPDKKSVSTGDSVQFTVRAETGDRVEGATITTDRGHSAVTDMRGMCEFVFEDHGDARVTVAENTDEKYRANGVSIIID